MPEGHTIHRLATEYGIRFGGRAIRATSPQGKFTDGAALLDGSRLTGTDAHGKHLFLGFGAVGHVHIHLGIYGKVTFGDTAEDGEPPAPVGAVRLRLHTGAGYADLRGPSACELVTEAEKDALHARLGDDPLRSPDTGGTGGAAAWARISRSRTTIAALLMDQRVVAGVGNCYRAEILFRHGIDPYRQGRHLTRAEWDTLWADLVPLMRDGVRTGVMNTVRPEHSPEAMGRPPRVDGHGGEVYVYRRAGRPCHLCGTEVRTAVLAARNLFWCPRCQRT